jgi:hypothetical protein
MINLQEAIDKISRAGTSDVRIVSDSSNPGLRCTIEYKTGGVWTPLIQGLSPALADDIIKRASNRTLLG